ncbi:MAG: hypothetical protein GXZ07_06970 [Firmicutes bacterium]|nr:hypothetical protein [Bacillota bacterium]
MHSVEMRKRQTQAFIKEELVEYEQVYYRCNVKREENKFVPSGIMDENLLRARDAYREKHHLLTSKDIKKIRNIYDLSQSDFAALLGWDDITVTRYETKAIQDGASDSMMKMIYNNPLFAIECLEKHKERFNKESYDRIRSKITQYG